MPRNRLNRLPTPRDDLINTPTPSHIFKTLQVINPITAVRLLFPISRAPQPAPGAISLRASTMPAIERWMVRRSQIFNLVE